MNVVALTFRKAMAFDAEETLRAHHDAIYGKADPIYTVEQLAGWTVPITPESIKKQQQHLADPNVITYVAEYNGVVIGFSTIIPQDNELRAVYVAPGLWRGVGSKLLGLAEAEAQKCGLAYLVCDSSLNAETFYLKHHYETIERTTHTFRSGITIPCLKMMKRF